MKLLAVVAHHFHSVAKLCALLLLLKLQNLLSEKTTQQINSTQYSLLAQPAKLFHHLLGLVGVDVLHLSDLFDFLGRDDVLGRAQKLVALALQNFLHLVVAVLLFLRVAKP